MKGNYFIDNNNKKVIAKMNSITEKQLTKVRKYILLGYELEEYQAPKKEKYTQEGIRNLLKDKPDMLAIYESKCKEPILDENGEQKLTKTGKPRVKGHINGLKWYRDTFEPKPPKKEKK